MQNPQMTIASRLSTGDKTHKCHDEFGNPITSEQTLVDQMFIPYQKDLQQLKEHQTELELLILNLQM
jgi:hypothetical protein